MTPALRHARHRIFPGIGDEGQERLQRSRIAIVGCGALGSRSAELLGRAGCATEKPGLLRIIDRDYVDLTNLQRQALFDEDDASRARPKAAAAERHLRQIDSSLLIEAVVRDLTARNALELLGGVDLIIDGTDNFRTRYIINDAAIARGVPWIYGAAVGSRGMLATIVPGRTPCLRCLLAELPPLGAADTCDTAGIITPLPTLVASLQVSAAMRLIVSGEIDPGLTAIELWQTPLSIRPMFAGARPDPRCPSCGLRQLPALADHNDEMVTLCGRNSVQLTSHQPADLDALARRFANSPTLHRHPQSLTLGTAEGKITLFDDGRIIIEGTTDPIEAQTLVARYLGA
jgi:molybdopterin/thiamine biosynthesis adenylyltransferase